LISDLLAIVADQVRDEVALGAVLDAKIAVLENLAQAGRPLGLAGEVVHEVPGFAAERFALGHGVLHGFSLALPRGVDRVRRDVKACPTPRLQGPSAASRRAARARRRRGRSQRATRRATAAGPDCR